MNLYTTPRPSLHHHHVWLLLWCSLYWMLLDWCRCNRTQTLQKVQLLSDWCIPLQIIPLQVLEIIKMFSSGFHLGKMLCRPFLICLFLMLGSWTLTLAYSSLEFGGLLWPPEWAIELLGSFWPAHWKAPWFLFLWTMALTGVCGK